MTITLLVRWLLGWALCMGLSRLPEHRLQGQPRVSVLIPARNEERTLPNLLPALRGQSFQPLEVIVIDDHSTDRTAAIATRAGCRHWCRADPGVPGLDQGNHGQSGHMPHVSQELLKPVALLGVVCSSAPNPNR